MTAGGLAGRRLVAAMCLAEVLGMAGFAGFPALLPTFLAEWRLSNTEAGWIGGIYYAGYLAAVPILLGITDRIDSRRVFVFGCVVTAVAGLGFAVAAQGFWSALLLRALAGAGLAGTYMTGLKALTDRIDERLQSRAVAFYTASFGIGSSLSFVLAGMIAGRLGWPWAFGLAAAGPVAAMAIVIAATAPLAPRRDSGRKAFDFRPVFRNRPVVAFILAYTFHNWELFGLRAWIVTYLAFAQTQVPAGATGTGWSPTLLAALINLVGLPSSVLGNEAAQRFGRRRVVIVFMTVSALLAGMIGFTSGLAVPLVVALFIVYGVTVSWDSSSITAGVIAAAGRDERGAVMAMHSMIGFAGAFTGPLAFGVVLDLFGGGGEPLAWGMGFAAMGLGVILGPLAIIAIGRPRPS